MCVESVMRETVYFTKDTTKSTWLSLLTTLYSFQWLIHVQYTVKKQISPNIPLKQMKAYG